MQYDRKKEQQRYLYNLFKEKRDGGGGGRRLSLQYAVLI